MDAWLPEWLSLWLSGAGAEVAVFVTAFISATLMPGGSEVFLIGAVMQTPEDLTRIVRLVALAALGNTLGAMTTWGIGRLLPSTTTDARALRWLRRWGAPALLLSWLPVVGDALPLAAGWLRIAFLSALVWTGMGKLLRYAVLAWGAVAVG